MAEIDRLTTVFDARFDKLEQQLDRGLARANRTVHGAVGRMQKGLDSLSFRKFETDALRIQGALAALGVGLSIQEVTRYADAWTEARNKLAAAGVEVEALGRRQQELADLANETRSGFGETVDLYAKLTRATEALGASQGDVARATEIVNKAFKAGGAVANEQAASMLQLSQALGSGVLQGDELRSLRENAPLIAKAIAEEFETTVSGLKKLGAEGELTSGRVLKAILDGGKAIDAQFSTTVPTIADSLTKLQTEFGRYINQVNASTDASQILAGFIVKVADNLELLGDVVATVAVLVGGRYLAAMVLAAGATTAAAVQTIRYQAALIALEARQLGVTRATVVATAATRGFTAAIAANPIGAILVVVTALVAGIGLLAAKYNMAAAGARELSEVSDRATTALDAYEQAARDAANASGVGATKAIAHANAMRLEASEAVRAAKALREKTAA